MNDDVDKGRKRQEKLAKDAERKRKQRMSYSEEKKEQRERKTHEWCLQSWAHRSLKSLFRSSLSSEPSF